jgi:hypothetical protein
MPRNGSGVMSIPNTFVDQTTITAGAHNSNWSDAASEISNSVAVDGQSQMSGQLKIISGTAAAPGLVPGSDLDTGLYRIGGDNLGVACAGAKVLDIGTAGLDVTGALTVGSGAVYKTGGTDVAIADGGTGQATATAGFDALSPTTRGDIITRGAANNARLAIGAADTVLKSDGTDPAYGKIVNANITDGTIAHAKLASGVTASQAVMETATAVDSLVAPGRQHFHPGHPKGGGLITGGGTPVLTSSYNITGISDIALGVCEVTIANDMNDANYWVVATVENADSDLATTEAAGVYVTSKAAGSFQLVGEDGDEDGGSNDRADWYACAFTIFGDMP